MRTNHSDTLLSFSDLLMSTAIANWKKDAHQQIGDLGDKAKIGPMPSLRQRSRPASLRCQRVASCFWLK
jgi:hypothetical protein